MIFNKERDAEEDMRCADCEPQRERDRLQPQASLPMYQNPHTCQPPHFQLPVKFLQSSRGNDALNDGHVSVMRELIWRETQI